jgi:hypothetical protein
MALAAAGSHARSQMQIHIQIKDKFDAHFLMPVIFISCMGARDDETAKKLAEAFKRGDMKNVRSLRRNSEPDDTNSCAGHGWWLSTAEILSYVSLLSKIWQSRPNHQ